MVVPQLLFDLSRIDLQKIEIPIEEIRKINPHRYEFEQLSGVYAMIPSSGSMRYTPLSCSISNRWGLILRISSIGISIV